MTYRYHIIRSAFSLGLSTSLIPFPADLIFQEYTSIFKRLRAFSKYKYSLIFSRLHVIKRKDFWPLIADSFPYANRSTFCPEVFVSCHTEISSSRRRAVWRCILRPVIQMHYPHPPAIAQAGITKSWTVGPGHPKHAYKRHAACVPQSKQTYHEANAPQTLRSSNKAHREEGTQQIRHDH